MVENVKFIYGLIIILFIYLVAMNVDGKSFFSFSNFVSYFLYNVLSHFSNIILLSLFSFTAVTYCFQNYDCPDDMCSFPDISWCNKDNICACA